jgi:hypothetical protein
MDLGKVVEYDIDGKQRWVVPFSGVWSAAPLKNGHILVTGNNAQVVCEMTAKGDTVWKFSARELPGYQFAGMQTAVCLDNGNTLINSWTGKGDGTAIQAIEVSPDHKLVWVLGRGMRRRTWVLLDHSGTGQKRHAGAGSFWQFQVAAVAGRTAFQGNLNDLGPSLFTALLDEG